MGVVVSRPALKLRVKTGGNVYAGTDNKVSVLIGTQEIVFHFFSNSEDRSKCFGITRKILKKCNVREH